MFQMLPNLSREGEIKEKNRSNSQDKAAKTQTEYSNGIPYTGQPDGGGKYGLTYRRLSLGKGSVATQSNTCTLTILATDQWWEEIVTTAPLP